MIKKENARPGVAAPEQAMFEHTGLVDSVFHCDSITGEQRTQEKIEALLHKGRENSLRTSFLSAVTGLTQRQVVMEVSRERANGVPILSSCRGEGGYYLPADGEQGQRETEECLRTMRSRAVKTLQAVKALAESTQRLEGQLAVSEYCTNGTLSTNSRNKRIFTKEGVQNE